MKRSGATRVIGTATVITVLVLAWALPAPGQDSVIDPLAPPPPLAEPAPPRPAPPTRAPAVRDDDDDGGATPDPARPAAPKPAAPPAPGIPADPKAELAEVAKLIGAKGVLPAKLADAEAVQLYHRRAVAFSMIGDVQQARTAMRRVLASDVSSRRITLNAARLDILSKADALRAALTLETYLRTTDPPDDEALALMGVALATAARDGRPLPDGRVAAYEELKTLLEAQHPGQRLWGTKWISAAEYATLSAARDRALAAVTLRERRHLEAKRNAESTRRYYARSRRAIGTRLQAAPSDGGAVARANDVVRAAAEDLAAARRLVPAPPWVAPLKLEPPDPLPGQQAVAGNAPPSPAAAGGEPRPGVPRRVVFLVDASATGAMLPKFTAIKAEIVKAVGKMEAGREFAVVVAAPDRVMLFRRGWSAGGAAGAAELAEYFVTVTTSGAANPAVGIQSALAMKPDLVWFVTDGEFPDNDAILAAARLANRDVRARINTHTKFVNASRGLAGLSTLWRLSKEHGGVCVGLERDPMPNETNLSRVGAAADEPSGPAGPAQKPVEVPVGPSIFD